MYRSNGTKRRAIIVRWLFVRGLQGVLFAASGIVAFLLRFDFNVPALYQQSVLIAVAVWLVVKAIAFEIATVNRQGWRYVSSHDLGRLLAANLAGSVAGLAVLKLAFRCPVPRSIFILDFLLCLLATSGIRVLARVIDDASRSGRPAFDRKRTLIYGAGDAGLTLLREIRNNPKLPYQVVGFVDDQPDKRRLSLSGIRVLGGGDEIKDLVQRLRIQTVLIAIPSASGSEMIRLLALCHEARVECKTVPGMGEVIESRGLGGQIREVEVDDLLGRTPVRLDEGRIRGYIENKMVLVTGAAGSIGSELCRQVARFQPAGIVGFEIAESPLFELDREMQIDFPSIRFVPEIGSVQNVARLDEVMATYRPAVVFHAAAYKHVPLMETHVFEAVENNIFGTYHVAATAEKYGVKDLVLISTDKAVRPTNVMGATKRVAELMLRRFDEGNTKCIAVRFGNVLGSNGSVIPIFKKQIKAGGPVTVTHPEMRRFFMTIPESCQLVLQAAAIGQHGQICVLDMGMPVKIVDLAKNLILLSGLRPDEDIKLEFTGVRPGEKLYEELSTLLEDTVPTEHEKIRIFVGNGIGRHDVEKWMESLHHICLMRDTGRLVVALKEMVLDYSPSAHLLKRIVETKDTHAFASIN